MKRFQPVGLLSKTRRQRRNFIITRRRRERERRLESGVERFVHQSQLDDLILHTNLQRAHPEFTLEFAEDVDWQLEYFCDALMNSLRKLWGWMLLLFQFLLKIFACLSLRQSRKIGDSGGNDENEKDDNLMQLEARRESSEDFPLAAPIDLRSSLVLLTKYVMWRYRTCTPFMHRRIIKRKWFLRPETKQWAKDTLLLFQTHVNRGFRRVCSKIGKDVKVHVGEHVFYGEEAVLSSQSELFRLWFQLSRDEEGKEIETSSVTPEEMEAILVYMYTLTWPTDMMTRSNEGMSRSRSKYSLRERFLEITALYGISLSLTKENPYETHSTCRRLPPLHRTPMSPPNSRLRGDNIGEILADSIHFRNLQKYASCTGGPGVDGAGDSFCSFNNFGSILGDCAPTNHRPASLSIYDEDAEAKERVVRSMAIISTPSPIPHHSHPNSSSFSLRIVNEDEERVSATRAWVLTSSSHHSRRRRSIEQNFYDDDPP